MTKSSHNISKMDNKLYKYLLKHSVKENDVLKRLRKETSKHVLAKMEITPDVGQLLSFLIKLTNTRYALEIGTFTGYSTLWIAQALPDDGKVVTCETRLEFAEIALQYWEDAEVKSKIDLEIGPAQKTLKKRIKKGEAGFYDFAFIDADKENYDFYYELCLELVRPGGLICVDNVLWSGRVVDDNFTNPNTIAIREINTKIYTDQRVESCMFPIGDGITLVMKK